MITKESKKIMKSVIEISEKLMFKNKKINILSLLGIFLSMFLITSILNFTINSLSQYADNKGKIFAYSNIMITSNDKFDIESEFINQKGISDWKFIDINGEPVYTEIPDTLILKKKYNITQQIGIGEVIINKSYAKKLHIDKYDILKVRNKNYRVINIVNDLPESKNNLILFNKTDIENVNDELLNRNIYLYTDKEKELELYNKIKKENSSINVLLIDYSIFNDKEMSSLVVMMGIISIGCLVIAILFLLSIFNNITKKYKPAMIVLKSLGADNTQIQKILYRQVNVLLVISTIKTFIFGFIVNRYVIPYIKKGFNIGIQVEDKFYILVYLGVCIVIVATIKIVLSSSINRYAKCLPSDIRSYRNIGIEVKKLANFKANNYITLSFKLIMYKFKENKIIFISTIIFTILMVSAMAFVNDVFNKGFTYIDSKYLTKFVLEDEKGIDNIKAQNIISISDKSNINIFFSTVGVGGKLNDENISAQSFPLKSLYKIGFIDKYQKNSIFVKQKIFDKLNLKIGDKVNFTYTGKNNNNEYVVSGIVEDKHISLADVVYDYNINENEYVDLIYIDGNNTETYNIVNMIKNIYPNIRASSKDTEIELANKIIKERFGTGFIVIYSMLILIGAVWVLSMKMILYDRKKDYYIIRLQGMNRLNMFFMLVIQSLIYTVTSALVGMGISIFINTIFDIGETTYTSVIMISLYFIGINCLVIKDIFNISRNEDFIDELKV